MRFLASLSIVGIVSLATLRAEADETKNTFASVAFDAAALGGKSGNRTDIAYFTLVTPRAHWMIDEKLSLGLGVPLWQILPLFAKVEYVFPYGLGVNMPLEVVYAPEGRKKNGVLFYGGGAPLLVTADVCVNGGHCPGAKSLALIFGAVATAGAGYQWKDGTFIRASATTGPLFPAGRKSGVPALQAMYMGAWLGFGFAFD